jgi:hypothetical protein
MISSKCFWAACFAVLAMLTLPAAAAVEPMKLAPVYFGKTGIAFLNTDTIKGDRHAKMAWTVWVNSPPAVVDKYRARVEVMLMAFDCAKPAFQIRFVRLFDDAANVLVATPFDANAPFTPTNAKSGEAQMEYAVCNHPPRGYKPLTSIATAIAITKAMFKESAGK